MARRPRHPRVADVAVITVGLVVLLAFPLVVGRPPRPLAADEQVVLFPGDASFDEAARVWLVPIHGWVYEPEQDDRLRASAVTALRALLGATDVAETATFEQRVRPFLVDSEGHKQIRVRVAGQVVELPSSDDSGHFVGSVRIPEAQADAAAEDGMLRVAVVADPPLDPPVTTQVRLLPGRGVSVISDIDDTIKITELSDKHELVRNTFLRPFRPAPGMAALYRGWASRGVSFHFVSSSPWQLFAPLERFVGEAGFPPASMALKRFSLTDSTLLDLFADPEQTKPPTIRAILEAYPERRFCLVGDSGEKDPEVYGHVARAFAERIVHIYIRDVTSEPPEADRYRRAFASLPRDRWTVFRDVGDLPLCE